MTRVVNLRREDHDVYIGRPSLWANPFSTKPSKYDVVKCASVEEAVERYREYIVDRLYQESSLRQELRKLKGKRLGCFCAPRLCHGDVLKEIIEKMFPD
jgi:hypothetical protein